MAALQPISNSVTPGLNQTSTASPEHLADFYSWSKAKQNLITARIYELPDQGDSLDQDVLRIMLNIEDFQQILNRNASSIADVYSVHINLNKSGDPTNPTQIFQILNEQDPEEKKGLYAPILGILAYQIIFSQAESDDNDKHNLFFNFVLKLLVNIPTNHLEAFFKALAEVVRPDDEVELPNVSMCKMPIIDIEDTVEGSTNKVCGGCQNKNSCTPKAAEDLGHDIVPVMSLINSIAELAQAE